MTDKRTLNGIEKINSLIEKKDFDSAIISGKSVINSLILASHYKLHKIKIKTKPRPALAIKETEEIIATVTRKTELKKIVNKKTFKQTLKWFYKYNNFILNPETRQPKKTIKLAVKTCNLINLLNQSHIKIKNYLNN